MGSETSCEHRAIYKRRSKLYRAKKTLHVKMIQGNNAHSKCAVITNWNVKCCILWMKDRKIFSHLNNVLFREGLAYFSRMMLNRILLQDCRCWTGLPAELSPNIKKTHKKQPKQTSGAMKPKLWQKNKDCWSARIWYQTRTGQHPLPEVCQGLRTVKGRGTGC